MASEYLKWKARDVQQREHTEPTSKKKRFFNWLHYNIWWIIVLAVITGITVPIVLNVFGVGQIKPDYVFAFIGVHGPNEAAVVSFEEEMAAFGKDRNGDGKVTVKLNVYAATTSSDAEVELYYNYATDTKLVADLNSCDSYFFIVDDAKGVQLEWQLFANDDGMPPEEYDYSAINKVYTIQNCPKFAKIGGNWQGFQDFEFGRRCFYNKDMSQYAEDDALWHLLIEGATR